MSSSPNRMTSDPARGIATWVILTALGTLALAFIAWQAHDLAAKEDVRERTFKFHEMILAADEVYCRTKDQGVQSKVKLFIDRAAKLEPTIQNELVATDYIYLASIGSLFWPYEQTRAYGLRALDLGKENRNRVELYAANLVLGHLSFMCYRESQLRSDLQDARDRFRQAEEQIPNDGSPQNLELAEQLYLQLGQEELYVGNVDESDAAFRSAERTLDRLPRNGTSIYSVKLAKQSVRDGQPPRLPCPSAIVVAPALLQNPSLKESQFSVQDNNGGGVAAQALLRVDADELSDRVADVESAVKSIDDLRQDFEDFKETMEKDRNSTDADTNSDAPDGSMSSNSGEDADPKPRRPPGRDHPKCLIKVFNNNYFSVRPIINGYDDEEFTIPPKQLRRFYVGCDTLSLKRRDNGNEKIWDASIFRRSDGSRAEPFFEATNCCFEIRALE